MTTIFKTTDGTEFHDRNKASEHEAKLGRLQAENDFRKAFDEFVNAHKKTKRSGLRELQDMIIASPDEFGLIFLKLQGTLDL